MKSVNNIVYVIICMAELNSSGLVAQFFTFLSSHVHVVPLPPLAILPQELSRPSEQGTC